MSRTYRRCLLAVCLAAILGCSAVDDDTSGNAAAQPSKNDSESVPSFFRDITAASGVDFVHDAMPGEEYFMPRTVGSGVAVFDYDGDGRLDLYFVQNGGPESKSLNRLYRRDEQGKYHDVSAGSGLDFNGYGMGVATGDVNNDGKVDMFVTEYGRARLLLNESTSAKPQFTDVSAAAGIASNLWGTSASMVDYDRDGWLDILLVNYVDYDPSRWCADGAGKREFCGPSAFVGRVAMLFHNRGGKPPASSSPSPAPTAVSFENVAVTSGISRKPGPGLGVFCADFNGDRWPDLFISNDGKPNHLWINQQNGTFKEEAPVRGLAYDMLGKTAANMGVAIGDVNGDGLFDIFVTHLNTETHTLWMQGSRGIFEDRTAASGVAAAEWKGTGFGAVMADFDNDGDLDLTFANGRVERGARGQSPNISPTLAPFWAGYAERNQLLVNDGKGKYRDVSSDNPALCSVASVYRGLAAADLDDDGGMDLIVTRIAEPPLLLRNESPHRGHWLAVRAIDPRLRRDAIGAEVRVRVGGEEHMRWINPAYSYLCSNDPRAHFGLGAAGRVDRLAVTWPDGLEEEFDAGAVDRVITLQRGAGRPVAAASAGSKP